MNQEQRLAAEVRKNRGKYFCWASRPATIQRISTLAAAWYQYFGTRVINLRGSGQDTCYYFERAKYERMSLELQRHFNSPVFVSQHLRHYRQVSRTLLAVGRQALKVHGDRANLLQLFTKYQAALIDYAPYFVTTFSVDDYVFPALVDKLRRYLAPAKYDAALEVISSPTLVFGYQRYQRALVQMRSAAEQERVVRDFRWIKEYSFQEKLLDRQQAREDRQRLFHENLQSAILKIPAACRRNQDRLSALLRTIPDRRLRMQIKLVNGYINIKTERIENYKIFQTNFRNFFERLLVLVQAEQPAARYEDLISLTDREIIGYLRHGQKLDLRATSKRFAGQYVAASHNDQTHFLYDQRLIAQVRRAFLSVAAVQEIKGKVVAQGLVRGPVKLVVSKSDLAQFRTGQVLVANFTTPEYVPAMKKAAAIVTDDGGITCHAAIIARELGKPCVVGTKDATRLFKNGDLVEVDAGQGIVRIIKRHQ